MIISDELAVEVGNLIIELDTLAAKVREDRQELVRILGKRCQHLEISRSVRDQDDGYGKWWKVTVDVCKHCEFEKPSGVDNMFGDNWRRPAWQRDSA